MISELEQIAKELDEYRPEADAYNGKYIHKGWAKRIRELVGEPSPVAGVESGYSGDPDTRGDKVLRPIDLSECELGEFVYRIC